MKLAWAEGAEEGVWLALAVTERKQLVLHVGIFPLCAAAVVTCPMTERETASPFLHIALSQGVLEKVASPSSLREGRGPWKLCGLALIVLGVLVQVAVHNTPAIKNAASSATPLTLIVVGVIIFFISFFGCCGAWKENHCMVTTFAVLLSLIIIIEIGTAIAGYLSGIVHTGLKEIINSYKNSTADFRKSMDKLQEDLKCCGANSSSDWANFAADHLSVPDSCCKNVTVNCGEGNMKNANLVYQEGCQRAVEDLLKKNILWIMGIVFACLLMRGIRSGYEVM
ncbi:hypothetical protein JZ751_009296 [Albula glossodonta]|uniref:Tetraspanin n=1 Tax=Albula glossodonta TaxID=121402 RepID=A0A8T2N3H4_9TELE|nr:hypothetical protein JZ751_009296 [Albula glossodonta]